jgi:hypothetical protein
MRARPLQTTVAPRRDRSQTGGIVRGPVHDRSGREVEQNCRYGSAVGLRSTPRSPQFVLSPRPFGDLQPQVVVGPRQCGGSAPRPSLRARLVPAFAWVIRHREDQEQHEIVGQPGYGESQVRRRRFGPRLRASAASTPGLFAAPKTRSQWHRAPARQTAEATRNRERHGQAERRGHRRQREGVASDRWLGRQGVRIRHAIGLDLKPRLSQRTRAMFRGRRGAALCAGERG